MPNMCPLFWSWRNEIGAQFGPSCIGRNQATLQIPIKLRYLLFAVFFYFLIYLFCDLFPKSFLTHWQKDKVQETKYNRNRQSEQTNMVTTRVNIVLWASILSRSFPEANSTKPEDTGPRLVPLWGTLHTRFSVKKRFSRVLNRERCSRGWLCIEGLG